MRKPKMKKPEINTPAVISFAGNMGDLIDDLKHDEKKTHNECAEMLECSGSSLTGYLAKTQAASIEVLYRAAVLFGVSADWLLGLSQKDIRTSKPDVRAAAELTRLSDKAVERLNYNPPFKPMSPEEAERAIKEKTLPPRAWTDEEIELLSKMIVDGSLLGIIRHINNYEILAKYDALKRKRYELTGEREEGMTITAKYGTGEETVKDTNFSVSMELEQYKAQKAVMMYTEKLNSDAQAAYKNVGEQNGTANKKSKKGR